MEKKNYVSVTFGETHLNLQIIALTIVAHQRTPQLFITRLTRSIKTENK